MSKHTSNRIL